MNFTLSQISCEIKQSFAEKKLGFAAQKIMSPPMRGKYNPAQIEKFQPKKAGVLILLYEKEGEVYLVLTQRHNYKGVHGGQISLPGGKYEPTDETLEMTALRETQEEIGVKIKEINILASLTELYIPPSNFFISPFVAYTDTSPSFIKEESEVAEIIETKLTDLLNKENISEITIKRSNFEFSSPAYLVNDKKVWGATAMVLSELLEFIKQKFDYSAADVVG